MALYRPIRLNVGMRNWPSTLVLKLSSDNEGHHGSDGTRKEGVAPPVLEEDTNLHYFEGSNGRKEAPVVRPPMD